MKYLLYFDSRSVQFRSIILLKTALRSLKKNCETFPKFRYLFCLPFKVKSSNVLFLLKDLKSLSFLTIPPFDFYYEFYIYQQNTSLNQGCLTHKT